MKKRASDAGVDNHRRPVQAEQCTIAVSNLENRNLSAAVRLIAFPSHQRRDLPGPRHRHSLVHVFDTPELFVTLPQPAYRRSKRGSSDPHSNPVQRRRSKAHSPQHLPPGRDFETVFGVHRNCPAALRCISEILTPLSPESNRPLTGELEYIYVSYDSW